MKLLGRDIDGDALLRKIEARLGVRGLSAESDGPSGAEQLEPRVDPLSFNLRALEEHADPTQPLPLRTHRKGLDRAAVLLAKWAFRKSCQLILREAFARQRLFNGHVRQAYAELAAEVLRLREEIDQPRAGGRRAAPRRRTKPEHR